MSDKHPKVTVHPISTDKEYRKQTKKEIINQLLEICSVDGAEDPINQP